MYIVNNIYMLFYIYTHTYNLNKQETAKEGNLSFL